MKNESSTMKLSKNLSLAEVTKSTTAKRLGINNVPDDEWVIENLRQVAINVFQPLRDAFGCPIYVSSRLSFALSSTVLSAARYVVSTWRGEHSTLMQTYTESVQTLRSSTGYERTLRLIRWCGNLVIKTILIGFTSVMCMMALIVVGASRLVVMMRERFTTK